MSSAVALAESDRELVLYYESLTDEGMGVINHGKKVILISEEDDEGGGGGRQWIERSVTF